MRKAAGVPTPLEPLAAFGCGCAALRSAMALTAEAERAERGVRGLIEEMIELAGAIGRI